MAARSAGWSGCSGRDWGCDIGGYHLWTDRRRIGLLRMLLGPSRSNGRHKAVCLVNWFMAVTNGATPHGGLKQPAGAGATGELAPGFRSLMLPLLCPRLAGGQALPTNEPLLAGVPHGRCLQPVQVLYRPRLPRRAGDPAAALLPPGKPAELAALGLAGHLAAPGNPVLVRHPAAALHLPLAEAADELPAAVRALLPRAGPLVQGA